MKRDKSKTIFAKTFTATYDIYEDRIRFVINYQDIDRRVDFMISRRFMINIIPSIDEFIYKYYSDNPTIKTQPNHPTPYEIPQIPKDPKIVSPTQNSDLELLKRDGELLHKIDLSYNPKTKQTTLLFHSSTHRVKAILDTQTLPQVINMLKKSIPYFSWGIAMNF